MVMKFKTNNIFRTKALPSLGRCLYTPALLGTGWSQATTIEFYNSSKTTAAEAPGCCCSFSGVFAIEFIFIFEVWWLFFLLFLAGSSLLQLLKVAGFSLTQLPCGGASKCSFCSYISRLLCLPLFFKNKSTELSRVPLSLPPGGEPHGASSATSIRSCTLY